MTQTILSDAQATVKAIMDKAQQAKPQNAEERELAKAAELAVEIATEFAHNIANGHDKEGDYKHLKADAPESFYMTLADILRPAEIYVSKLLEVTGRGRTLKDARVQRDFDQRPMPEPSYYAHTGPAEAIVEDQKAGHEYDGELLATF